MQITMLRMMVQRLLVKVNYELSEVLISGNTAKFLRLIFESLQLVQVLYQSSNRGGS